MDAPRNIEKRFVIVFSEVVDLITISCDHSLAFRYIQQNRCVAISPV